MARCARPARSPRSCRSSRSSPSQPSCSRAPGSAGSSAGARPTPISRWRAAAPPRSSCPRRNPASALGAFVDPPPIGERPPVVVLSHGISSDRANLSSLARKLAGAGFAVLTLDHRGHGENRNPFPDGRGRADALAPDFAAAVDFLRTSPLVDGSRIAVMGHSMGAGAALDFATRDSGLDAVVAISGGWSHARPAASPERALPLRGRRSRAHQDAHRRARGAARRRRAAVARRDAPAISGRAPPSAGSRFPASTTPPIVWSDLAFAEIVAWLDAAFERPRTASADRLRIRAARWWRCSRC